MKLSTVNGLPTEIITFKTIKTWGLSCYSIETTSNFVYKPFSLLHFSSLLVCVLCVCITLLRWSPSLGNSFIYYELHYSILPGCNSLTELLNDSLDTKHQPLTWTLIFEYAEDKPEAYLL